MKKLPPETLRIIRDRVLRPEQHHNIILRQADCADLLGHIEALEAELLTTLVEVDRLRRSIP